MAAFSLSPCTRALRGILGKLPNRHCPSRTRRRGRLLGRALAAPDVRVGHRHPRGFVHSAAPFSASIAGTQPGHQLPPIVVR